MLRNTFKKLTMFKKCFTITNCDQLTRTCICLMEGCWVSWGCNWCYSSVDVFLPLMFFFRCCCFQLSFPECKISHWLFTSLGIMRVQLRTRDVVWVSWGGQMPPPKKFFAPPKDSLGGGKINWEIQFSIDNIAKN